MRSAGPTVRLLGSAAAGTLRHTAVTVGRGGPEVVRIALRALGDVPVLWRLALMASAGTLVVLSAMTPGGLAVVTVSAVAVCAVAGRRVARRTERAAAEAAARAADERLRMVYEALVPCFGEAPESATEPLYRCDGDWRRAIEEHGFDSGRLEALTLCYPAHFPDGDPDARASVERVLRAKLGRDRETRFHWDEERNRLSARVLPALPCRIAAQRFVTGPGETVLGFTEPGAVDRTVPVRERHAPGEPVDAAPVVWRTGHRSAAPHLLVTAQPGAGATSLLRSVVLQALASGGEVVLLDGGGAGEFGCFAGRRGVLAVESSPTGAGAVLEWASRETQRRLLVLSRERGRPGAVPSDPGAGAAPLWVVVDRPVLLSHRARLAGAADPQELLEVPLRHGRAGGVTVVVAEQPAALPGLSPTVWSGAEAKVVLGSVSEPRVTEFLGAPPCSTPPPCPPPGRGYVRLADGPVHRMQVPATPDPWDTTADAEERAAVAELLPPWPEPARTAGAGEPPGASGADGGPVPQADPATPLRPEPCGDSAAPPPLSWEGPAADGAVR